MRIYFKNTFTVLLLIISIAAESQNLKKVVTYYDIYKTKIQESLHNSSNRTLSDAWNI